MPYVVDQYYLLVIPLPLFSFTFLLVQTLLLLSLQCLTFSLFSGIVLHHLQPLFFLLKCHSPFVLSYFLVSCAASVLSSNVSFSLCVFYFLVFYAASLMFDYPLGLSHYSVMFSLTSVMWCFPFNSNL